MQRFVFLAAIAAFCGPLSDAPAATDLSGDAVSTWEPRHAGNLAQAPKPEIQKQQKERRSRSAAIGERLQRALDRISAAGISRSNASEREIGRLSGIVKLQPGGAGRVISPSVRMASGFSVPGGAGLRVEARPPLPLVP